MRRLGAALLALAVAAGTASLPAARADNVVVAINTKDGSTLFRSALSIRRVMGDTVDESNAAVAFASCDACETVAIALQVVLVMSDPDVVTPTNLALAINQQCTSCETVASAYQLVLGTGGVVRFTAEGNRRLAELRQALLALRETDLTPDELQAQIDRLTDELAAIVAEELVPAGPPADEEPAPTTTTTTGDDDEPAATTTTGGDEPEPATTTSSTTSTSSPTTTAP